MVQPAAVTRDMLRTLVGIWGQIVTERKKGSGLASLMLGGGLTHGVLIERGTWPQSAPWDRYRITPLIQQILDTDGHLKKTCRDVYTLALALEKLALDELAEAVPIDEPAGFDDIVVDHLLQQLFEADYRRRLYIRLYNVMVEDAPAPVELPGLPVAIRTLHRAQIP